MYKTTSGRPVKLVRHPEKDKELGAATSICQLSGSGDFDAVVEHVVSKFGLGAVFSGDLHGNAKESEDDVHKEQEAIADLVAHPTQAMLARLKNLHILGEHEEGDPAKNVGLHSILECAARKSGGEVRYVDGDTGGGSVRFQEAVPPLPYTIAEHVAEILGGKRATPQVSLRDVGARSNPPAPSASTAPEGQPTLAAPAAVPNPTEQEKVQKKQSCVLM